MMLLLLGQIVMIGNDDSDAYEPFHPMRIVGFTGKDNELVQLEDLRNPVFRSSMHKDWLGRRMLPVFSDVQYAEIERMIAEALGRGLMP